MRKFLKQSIRVKKSRYFYYVLGLMVLLFIAGFVHNNNLAYISLFFLFSLSFISVIVGRVNIKRAKFILPKVRVFVGDEVEINFLRKSGVAKIKKVYRFNKRGYNEFEALIFSDYPLKLATFFKSEKFKILVYPKKEGIRLKEFLSKNEMEFSNIKRYNGEDAKFIFWPSVAKGDIQVKEFKGGSDRKLIFEYEKLTGDKEKRISQLALLADDAFREGVEFEIVFPEFKISSKEGYDEVFKALSLY